MQKTLMILALIVAPFALSGCAAIAVGAAGAVVADEAMENKNGGDGLF